MPEEINCVFCGEAPSRALFTMGPRKPFMNEAVLGKLPRLVWRVCEKCGLIYLSPRLLPDEAAGLYDENYHDRHHEELRGWEFAKKSAAIERCVSGGKLLDIGCGYGYFQRSLGSHWQATGIEISEHACRFGRDNMSLDLRCATIETLAPEPGSYDAITIWDVVEHVPDPVELIRLAYAALRPGGALGLSTGLISAAVPRLAGKYWYYLNIPDHQFAFTLDWLKKCLGHFGFEIMRLEIHNRGFDFFIPFMKRFAVESAKWALGAAYSVTRSRAIASRLADKAPPLVPMFNDIVILSAIKKS